MKRATIALNIVFFLAMTVAVTFPGIQPFNRVRPFIFGIPFVFAWVLAWVAMASLVFYMLYRVIDR
jgi:hypothetical protein